MDFDTLAYIRHSLGSFPPAFVVFIAVLLGASAVSGCIAIYVAARMMIDALRDSKPRQVRREPRHHASH